MAAGDVEETLQLASDKTEVTQVKVKHRPRLLSDNGPVFVSQALKEHLRRYRLLPIKTGRTGNIDGFSEAYNLYSWKFR
jgi:transposase InsO family protein